MGEQLGGGIAGFPDGMSGLVPGKSGLVPGKSGLLPGTSGIETILPEQPNDVHALSLRFDLDEVCRKWQEKLRLQDWEIRALWDDEAPDGYKAQSDGTVYPSVEHRRATITLKRTSDFAPASAERYEAILVHELIHLLLALFCADTESGSPARYAEEQIVGALTEALTGYRFVDPSWRKLDGVPQRPNAARPQEERWETQAHAGAERVVPGG